MEINPLSQLYQDFIVIINQCVVKYNTLADKNETLETRRKADEYIRAYLKEDSFNTYYRYDMDLLGQVLGLTDENDILPYYYDRNKIPTNYRNTLLELTRKNIVDNYEEKNNYYRMLLGLPNYEDSEADFIYPDERYITMYHIPENTPIHELSDNIISIFENIGYIDKLIECNPDKKYLKFLGSNKIDLITSRRALNFSLLRIPYGITESSWNTFSFIYDQCREYFMTCIYIGEYRQTIDYYDNFIALCIMVMTIQQIAARTIKNTIERDFFDEYCVRTLFSVYGVPYHSFMDDNTRRQIIQNLNNLVKNKGTNQVIYDIASILGYDRINIFKYYLVRSQKFDENGVPIIIYKTDQETGEEVIDYEKTFDIYFQKVNIDDDDVYKTIINTNKSIGYHEIVDNDSYWIIDEKLNKELYESEYNFVETKYLGVSISYRMTKVIFENIYLIRMLLDKKDEISSVVINLPKISLYTTVSLFDAVVALCAILCKKNQLKGEILIDPSKILHVMGFDFENEFDAIREDIINCPYLENDLADYLKTYHTYNAEQINEVYNNMINLYDVLLERMVTTQSYDAYSAYKDLYHTLYYSNENKKIFNMGTEENPRYANTYLEYLEYINPDIYSIINSTTSDNLYALAEHVSNQVIAVIPNLKYLGVSTEITSTLEIMLVDLINFFKSYTVDMVGLNTIFVFDLKPDLIFRFIDKISIHNQCIYKDPASYSYIDSLTFTSKLNYQEKFKMRDYLVKNNSIIDIFDTEKMMDKIHSTLVSMSIKDGINMYDYITLKSNTKCNDKFGFRDKLFISYKDDQ